MAICLLFTPKEEFDEGSSPPRQTSEPYAWALRPGMPPGFPARPPGMPPGTLEGFPILVWRSGGWCLRACQACHLGCQASASSVASLQRRQVWAVAAVLETATSGSRQPFNLGSIYIHILEDQKGRGWTIYTSSYI